MTGRTPDDLEPQDLLGKLIEWLKDEGWTRDEIILFITRKLDGESNE